MKNTKFKWTFPALLAVALMLGGAGVPAFAATIAGPNLAAETDPLAAPPLDEPSVITTNALIEIEEAHADHKPARRYQDMVVFGRTVELKAGETAHDLVVIGGSAIVNGKVMGDAVAIFGSVTVNGDVKGDAVAVMGNMRLGTNSSVRGDTVAVGGNVRLAPGATIYGDAVAVCGAVERSGSDSVEGDVVGVGGFTHLGDRLENLGEWLQQCVFKLRPLAPGLVWVWVVAGVFCLIYFLVALVFPRPVQVCVNELSARPATTFLVGLLVKLLVPVIVIILAATGIGLLVVPILLAALFVGAIFGKVALFQHLGASLGRLFGFGMLQQPLVAFLLGIALITLLYLVPILGMITFLIVSTWGLGAAVTALFNGMGRERKPPQPSSFPGSPPPPGPPSALYAAVPFAPASGGAGESNPPAAFAAAAAVEPPPTQPGLPALLACPRAGFWERMGAAFLDLMLLCIPAALVGPFVLLVALAYFAGMWAWKGTTIGGIVLKLQVVRYDGGPLTFPVALVRGLAADFSALVFLLGFFWIGWDRDKQGWHDKIAGTVVVRLPHSMPLICL